MIEKMKKVNIIFTSHDSKDHLSTLQELGLVDIVYNMIHDVGNDTVKTYNDTVQALEVLASIQKSDRSNEIDESLSLHEVIKHIVSLSVEFHKLHAAHEECNQSISEMQSFGEISKRDVHYLNENNVSCALYRYPLSGKKHCQIHITDNDALCSQVPLFKKNDYCYTLVVSNKENAYTVDSQWEEVMLSDIPISELRGTLFDISNKMQIVQDKIRDYSSYRQKLQKNKIRLENELSVLSVHSEAKQYEQLLMIEGFIPQSENNVINAFCAQHSLGLILSEVKEEDDVPTKQKNLAPVHMMKPLFKLMDTVPGYKEFDISGMFLLALTLFFGMIIGDAGYGVVLLVSSLMGFVLIKKRNSLTTLTLFFLLWNSLATIAWGTMSGNWFGYAPFAETGLLSQFVVTSISIMNPNSAQNIWHFAFTVGLVHLCIAHLWGMIRGIQSKDLFYTINHLGSGIMIYGLYYLVLTLLLGVSFPPYALTFIIIGFALVIISADQGPEHTFFVGIGIGIAKILLHALDSLGNFADIISYIRLFAVGLASLSIASAFNDMSQAIMSSGTVVGYVGGVAILIFAHTFNLAMGLLAIIIHGVRLNILEFGMHIGMEWSGRAYSPFRKIKFNNLI